jgi:3-deoxy-manno-octulosonate cytidylyltransferase (CMP-KDO synthetase)
MLRYLKKLSLPSEIPVTMQKAIAIIPARFASTRFPGKPLVEIEGRTMIMRVYEQAVKAEQLQEVYVATDDARIFDHVTKAGGKAIMTSVDHSSGTERCLEAFQILLKEKRCTDNEIIINVQGDEPFILPAQIDKLVMAFTQPEINIVTLIKVLKSAEELNDPNCVKVVAGNHGQALYFSRLPIPYIRENTEPEKLVSGLHYKHIGMYAYRNKILAEICKLMPSPLEMAEKLEQLRWLEHGYKIHLQVTGHESIAIDSPSDLLKVTNIS